MERTAGFGNVDDLIDSKQLHARTIKGVIVTITS